MTAITHQKNDEIKEIIKLTTALYDSASEQDRRSLFRDVVRGYLNDMTLPKMREWHELLMSIAGSKAQP